VASTATVLLDGLLDGLLGDAADHESSDVEADPPARGSDASVAGGGIRTNQ